MLLRKFAGQRYNPPGHVSQSDTADARIRAVLALLPDIDQGYLQYCLSHYRQNHVERVVEKILLYNKGVYPKAGVSLVQLRNERLNHLNDAFPDIDVEALRRKILENPNLPVDTIAESIIAAENKLEKRLEPGTLEPWECFRSKSYVQAAKHQLSLEFPDLTDAQISAIMAESNFDYFRSRDKLPSVQPVWWNRVKNYVRISARKTVQFSLSNMPSTGCHELDFEIGTRVREQSITTDLEFAIQLNRKEYDQFNSNIECECCFGEYPWEEMICCTQGHLFCQECLIRFVKEGLYVQGNLRGVERIKCLSCAKQCHAYISPLLVDLALPGDIKKTLYECFAQVSLEKSGLPLISCQFCGYAEVEQVPRISFKIPGLLLLLAISVFFPAISVFLLLLFVFSQISRLYSPSNLYHSPSSRIIEILRKVARDKRGSVFVCQNTSCNRKTCLKCDKEWVPLHKCFEEEHQKLRLYIEKAMAEAIKRTCPNCNISFVKLDGCNKLVCPCGYAMCYICRKDIRIEGYRHFCQHFRAIRGIKCIEQCGKCDLYEVEDEAKILQDARDKAIMEYSRAHPSRNRSLDQLGPPISDFLDGEWLLELALYKLVEFLIK